MRTSTAGTYLFLAATLFVGVAWQQLPAIGAGALLHPSRRRVTQPPPDGCVAREFAGAGVAERRADQDDRPRRQRVDHAVQVLFLIEAVAAARITVPVLLIHGAEDRDTPPAHSERIHASLKGPSQLILVAGAHHNESLRGASVWREIDRWLARVNSTTRQFPTPK